MVSNSAWQCVVVARMPGLLFVSKLYRQMYAGTCIATDSARQSRARFWARLLGKPTRCLFQGKPLPNLENPPRSKPLTEAVAHAGNCTGRIAKPPCVSLTD